MFSVFKEAEKWKKSRKTSPDNYEGNGQITETAKDLESKLKLKLQDTMIRGGQERPLHGKILMKDEQETKYRMDS